MNEADIKVKQQIVDKIKSSNNILVTVSKNPSVDELSAAIGLATILNKIGKHTTAIFSGAVPPAINFLNPEKVFENTVDSLRDFIIALDKEKADHLRYKLEGDVVKIFITPYRTVITGDDLEFSQGDYNVELVLALGVNNQEHLDMALAAHGQIIHDVTVATFSAGQQSSQLGNMDWRDESASGLCEMVANISDSIKGADPVFDKQIATALLTGIVAATDRFSNDKTSPRVMTMAAQLMAAGADQQLIAAKLQESHAINAASAVVAVENTDLMTSTPIITNSVPTSTLPETPVQVSGNLEISHETETIVSTLPEPLMVDTQTLPNINAATDYMPTSTLPEMPVFEQNANIDNSASIMTSTLPEPISEPMLGGTLNATTDQAEDDARRMAENDQNTTILNHSYLGNPEPVAVEANPINGVGQTESTQDINIFADNATSTSTDPMMNLPMPPQLPDFSTLPPPPIPEFMPTVAPSMSSPVAMPASNDPGQFRIPGQ